MKRARTEDEPCKRCNGKGSYKGKITVGTMGKPETDRVFEHKMECLPCQLKKIRQEKQEALEHKTECWPCQLNKVQQERRAALEHGVNHYLKQLRSDRDRFWDTALDRPRIASSTDEQTEGKRCLKVSLDADTQTYFASEVGDLNAHCHFIRLKTTKSPAIQLSGEIEAIVCVSKRTKCGTYYRTSVVWACDPSIEEALEAAFLFMQSDFSSQAKFMIKMLGFLPLSYEAEDKAEIKALFRTYRDIDTPEPVRLELDTSDDEEADQ